MYTWLIIRQYLGNKPNVMTHEYKQQAKCQEEYMQQANCQKEYLQQAKCHSFNKLSVMTREE